jgi:hypothetical protein
VEQTSSLRLLVHVEEKEKQNSILIHVQSIYCFANLEFS